MNDDGDRRTDIVEVVIPLDTPACTVCGDITVDLDSNPRPCAKHPAAPLAPRGQRERN